MERITFDDPQLITSFVNEGYVVVKEAHVTETWKALREEIYRRYDKLLEVVSGGEIEKDLNGFAISIIDDLAHSDLFMNFLSSTKLLSILEKFLGPDICALGYDALWINAPEDSDPVLLKSLHSDAWTGTSTNTLFVKTFFDDVDKYNSVGVCPGSHLYGMIPTRNRTIDPSLELNLPVLNLDKIKAGDILIWHPLLIHSTIGHSDKATRISITSRYASQETAFSSQERALGYRTLKVGPMNQIKRIIGNDFLTPFRVYGGFVGVDRRMAHLYKNSEVSKIIDYRKYFK